MHTSWSDGVQSIEMAEGARKLGYEYIAITDQHGGLRIRKRYGSAADQKSAKGIDRINSEYEKRESTFTSFREPKSISKPTGRSTCQTRSSKKLK